MADDVPVRASGGIGPVHAILLSFPFPLFLGAMLSDWAYSSSYEIQWANFSSWLIAGALFVGGFLLLVAIVGAVARRREGGRPFYALVLLAMWILGLINAFVHARDGYASMPTGLVLSVFVTALAFVASWLGFSQLREGRRA